MPLTPQVGTVGSALPPLVLLLWLLRYLLRSQCRFGRHPAAQPSVFEADVHAVHGTAPIRHFIPMKPPGRR